MLFVVFLGLAALAAAEPPIQQKIEPNQPVVQQQQQPIHQGEKQQMVDEPVPLYKGIGELPEPLNTYGGYMNERYFPLSGQAKGDLFVPYKSIMAYPYRSNYFLRYMNKPVTEAKVAPKMDYDSQEYYHQHEVNHHHMVNNVHDFKQTHVVRKVDEDVDVPYLPYSPMPVDKYNYYSRGYPNRGYVNKYYGKSFDQDYVQPWTPNFYSSGYPYLNKYYGKSLDQDYVMPWTPNFYKRYLGMDYTRNLGKSLGFKTPVTTSILNVDYIKPLMSQGMDVDTGYVKPIVSRNYNFKTPITARNLDVDFIKPVMSQGLDVDTGYVKPIVSRNYNFKTPITARNLDVDFIKPVMSQGFGVDAGYVKPVVSRNLGVQFTQPTPYTNVDVEYAQPITQQSSEVEYVPQIVGKNIGYKSYYPNSWPFMQPYSYKNLELNETPFPYYNMNLERSGEYIQPSEGRFKRDTEPLTHQVPVTPKHHEAVGTIPQEGLRQDIQLTANLNEQKPIQVEDHVSQQPIQRQTRGSITQTVAVPPYTYYPYYLNPYLPIQSPLVTRSTLYPFLPYYYDFLLRK